MIEQALEAISRVRGAGYEEPCRALVSFQVGSYLIARGFDPDRLPLVNKLLSPDDSAIIDAAGKEPSKGPRNRWGGMR